MGVEYLGLWTSYLTDLEMLHLIQIIFEPLGIPVTIKVNSLGSKADQIKYKQVLVDYLSQYKDQLCPDCLARLETNPLRILDCKIDSHKDFFKNIPSILDYISPIELQRLKDLERAYNDIEFDANIQIDPRLVRGLDYYSHMVFEVYAKDEKFASYGAIGAGGNYDNLVSELGGPNYVGVGFALGFDRLVEIFAKNENKSFKLSRNPNIQFILLDERAREFVTKMALITAGGGIRVHFAQQINSLKSQLADASKRKAQFAVIVGGDEYDNATITIKDLETAKQISIPNTEFKDWLEMTFFQITTPFLNED
jgi:histidyl-tRNA synthetase